MTFIDRVLARARLAASPYRQEDIDAATARITARIAARQKPSAPAGDTTSDSARTGTEDTQPSSSAAADLRTLCRTLLGHPRSLADLRQFLTTELPEPAAARTLGCILALTGETGEDAAAPWWQYAAGAGDPASGYCLYLHHLALGDTTQARWWYHHYPARSVVLAHDVPTVLRVLRALRGEDADLPDTMRAVLVYTSAAVSYVDDDMDLPLPDPDFRDRIAALAAAALPPRRTSRPCSRLPVRKSEPATTERAMC